MPVHESTIGVIFPGPDVQSVERRQPKAVGAFKKMKELPHELRQAFRVLCIPHVGKNQIVGADQLQHPVRRGLINYDLRMSDVNDTAAHKGTVYVMQPHGA
jgi:hypothetical protein